MGLVAEGADAAHRSAALGQGLAIGAEGGIEKESADGLLAALSVLRG